MSPAARNWDDLRPRLITGLALVVGGAGVIWQGGMVFAVTVAIVTGLMIWELARMVSPARKQQAIQLGVLTAATLLLARQLGGVVVGPLMLVPMLAGLVMLRAHAPIFAGYALGITIAGFGLVIFRDTFGGLWLFWLVLVVAGTDIAGYFGGRIIGGRKFWPAVSPKKTWAGILCGWAAAALIGAVFLTFTDAGRDLIWISALLSFASQMGDAAESAIKRRMGVKDSSNLLPGHGGLMDRFDALLGAALFLLLVALVVDVPGLRF